MSNKKHNIEEIKTLASTPVTPDSGYSKIYPKSDGEWYRLNDAGDEAPLGGVSGTVTSVGLALDTIGSDISISDSPITSAGEITLNIPDASSSARGALTSSDWSIFNNKVAGSGTSNTITKWTNSNTIGDSCIKENTTGQSISVGTLATPTYQTPFLTQTTDTHYLGGWFANTHVYSGDKIGIIVDTQGNTSGRIVGIENRAGSQQSPPVDINIGIFTHLGLSSSSLQDYGLYVDSDVTNNTFANIGAYIKSANNGTGGKYSVQLRDGSEAAGKFLKSITVDGKANWANIQVSDVAGAVSQINGTENYITKFTPSSSVITVSQIYDNGTCLAIGYGPTAVSSHKFSVNGENSNTSVGGYFINDNVLADLTGYGLVGASIKATGTNIGVSGRSIGTNTGTNIGISGAANNGSTANIGGHFIATGSNSRAVKLEDSTAASYRVLRCLDSSGNAEWTQNLYSFQAVTLSGSGIPATITASTQLNTSPVLNHGSSDPNAVQIILPATFDNGLASSYNTSTGVFTAPETGWYLVGVSISLTNNTGWPIGTSLLTCVELTNDTATTIILGSSTVDNYQPRQILLDSNRLVYLGTGQQFRLNILLKGTANYTKINTDSIKWSVIRTA